MKPEKFDIIDLGKPGAHVPEIITSVWRPSPEDVIFDALRDCDLEQIEPEAMPGPVLRLLGEFYKKERYKDAVLRYFKITNRITGNFQYAIIPTDTKRFGAIFSSDTWLKRREQKWVEIESMTPEQVESAVAEIVDKYLTKIINPDGSFHGLDLAIEVFNWTGFNFGEACAHAAKELIKQAMAGRIKKSQFYDVWVFADKESEKDGEE